MILIFYSLQNFYVVVYGQVRLILTNSHGEEVSIYASLGQSIGEEILFETDPEAEDYAGGTTNSFLPRPRSTSAFTVVCDSERACLLQLSV